MFRSLWVTFLVLQPVFACAAPLDEPAPVNLRTAPDAFAPPTAEEANTDATQPEGVSREAAAAFQAGQIAECLAKLRALAARQPSLPPPQILLAGMFLSVGKLREAQQILEEAAAEGSQHPALYISFADIALGENRVTDAAVHLEMAKTAPLPSTWSEAEKLWLKASLLERQATVAQRRGNWEQTQATLAQLTEMQPDKAALRARWATALFHAGRQRQAYEQFDMAFQQQPQLGRAEIALANLSAKQGDFAAAERWYRTAAEAEPENPLIPWAWGMLLLLQNRADDAARQADAAEKLGLDSPALLLLRGIIARLKQQPSKAEVYLSKAWEQSPQRPEAAYHLVAVLLEQKVDAKRVQAKQIAEDTVQATRGASLAWAALSQCLLADGELEEAEKAARNGAATPQASPESLYVLGTILTRLKQREEARLVALRLKSIVTVPTIFVERAAATAWTEAALSTSDAAAEAREK